MSHAPFFSSPHPLTPKLTTKYAATVIIGKPVVAKFLMLPPGHLMSAFAFKLYLVVPMLRQSLNFHPQSHPTSSVTVPKLFMQSSHAGYVILAFAHNFGILTGGINFYVV